MASRTKLDATRHTKRLFSGLFKNFSKIDKPYKSFIRIVRGYESIHKNELEQSKNKIVCTLFKQPLSNSSIYAGIFSENGDILDLFEST